MASDMRDARPKLDEVDLRILKEMERDGRQTVSEIAERTDTSRSTAARKLQRLLDEGILRITGVVAPHLLGFRTEAMIGINAVPRRVDSIAEKLATYEDVHVVAVTAGRYDIVVWTLFREPDELSRFLRSELAQIPGILRSETIMSLHLKKLSLLQLYRVAPYSRSDASTDGQGNGTESTV
ncbi:MAG: Lrp/AsnC family transcriptional regulator [Chloroflexi bacterium]|nr:Lrp/AsnC family transcriptional regulator [Chloroflexota bacterium]